MRERVAKRAIGHGAYLVTSPLTVFARPLHGPMQPRRDEGRLRGLVDLIRSGR
jgi:hypothetical protein